MSHIWRWIVCRVGLVTAAMAAMSLNEWAVVIGIFCTVITCLVNWYYEHKKYRLVAEGNLSEK